MSQRFDDLATGLNEMLTGVQEADKDLPEGTEAYADAVRSLEQMAKTVSSLRYPVDEKKMTEMKTQLENTMELCKVFMDTKDAEILTTDPELPRFDAVERAYDFCKQQMEEFDLQEEAAEAEMYAAFAGMPIPESDVGNGAEELRFSVFQSLNLLLRGNAFGREEELELLADMALLEMIKQGREVDEEGNILAGGLETALAADPTAVAKAIQDNAYFQAVTENMTDEGLRTFVLNDGGKVLAGKMFKFAQQSAVEEKDAIANELEEEMEEEMQATLMGGMS